MKKLVYLIAFFIAVHGELAYARGYGGSTRVYTNYHGQAYPKGTNHPFTKGSISHWFHSKGFANKAGIEGRKLSMRQQYWLHHRTY